MSDWFVFRSLPLFTGSLAFLSACGGTSSTDSGGSTDGSTGPTTSVSVTGEESTSSADSTGPVDTGTTDPTLTTSADGDSTDSGDPACGPTASCGEEAPVGWFGPVVHAKFPEGLEAPPCPDEYPDPGPTLLAGYNDPGPAVCGCECELNMPQDCNSFFTVYMGATCSTFIQQTPVTDACVNVVFDGFVRFQSNDYSYGGNIFCEETETESIAPLVWESAIRTCRLETPLACGDGGVCTPDPPEGFEDAWCIYQQGDLDCPAGPYSDKQMFFTSAEDTRDCTSCACGDGGVECSENELDIYAGPDCAGEPISSLPAENICTAAAGASVAGSSSARTACPVTEPSLPEGAVTPMGEFTFCCQPG